MSSDGVVEPQQLESRQTLTLFKHAAFCKDAAYDNDSIWILKPYNCRQMFESINNVTILRFTTRQAGLLGQPDPDSHPIIETRRLDLDGVGVWRRKTWLRFVSGS